MHRKAQQLFYGLAAFVLLSALFVLQSDGPKEVTDLRTEIQEEIRIGFLQTLGDQPWFEDIHIVYRGIEQFYTGSADNLIALLEPTQQEADMLAMLERSAILLVSTFGEAIAEDVPNAQSLASDEGKIAGLMTTGEFMQEEPIYNLIPEQKKMTQPVNGVNQWVTLRDNYTDELYCVAVYNGEFNKYLGPCLYD